MKNFKIGLQLYGVRNSMADDFEGTLKAVAEMGYEYVEFAGYYGKTSAEIKGILDKYGLKCVSVHQALDFFDENPNEKCEFLKGFGVKYSVIPWYEKEKLAGTPEWEKSLARFKRAADIFAQNGMILGYHNHEFEFEKYNGKYLHDYIFEAIDEEKIFPELDTCWVHYAGLDPVEKIKQFSGRVDIVHLKDFTCQKLGGGPAYELIDNEGKSEKKGTREENGFKFCPLGSGRQNFAKILAACEECGTEILIVEQDQAYEVGELEAARISRNYLKETFGI
ncbi:MAG: sugar phosphate isomerase/epimerase [Clostridia bacterium]|nr:sugar phosphate isomerase/epimerase [Clostridia bacterium]